MAEFDSSASQRVAELFETCRQLYRESYPQSLLDFDRLDLTEKLTQGTWAHARGHFADVYRGNLHDGTAVAVKTLRLPVYTPHDDKIYRTALLRFFREMNIWSALHHINIAPCLGYTLTGGNISLVSPWHDKGNLVQFLRTSPGASEPDLILDVAEGTQYLHTCSNPLVHGDVKGANILVNEHGIARLADFGISKQIDDMNRNTGFTTTSGITGTMPWMAPELERDSLLTFACDVYSCAGVFLEICCPGKTPYHYIRQARDLILAKDAGIPPDLVHYPEMDGKRALWDIMCTCWAHNPTERPKIRSVVQTLYSLFKLGPRVSQDITLRPPHNPGSDKKAKSAKRRPRVDSEGSDSGSEGIGARFKRPRPHWSDSGQDTSAAKGPLSPVGDLETPVPSDSSTGSYFGNPIHVDSTNDGVTMAQLMGMDLDDVPPKHLKGGSDWHAIFNPQVTRASDIALVMTFAHPSVALCVRFSPDGKYLATGCERTAQVYDIGSGEKTHTLVHVNADHKGKLYVRTVSFSPDGELVATGASDKRLRIWDLEKRKIRTIFDGHTQEIHSVEFSPDGSKVVSGSGDMTCRIWELETGESMELTDILTNSVNADVTSVAFSPDGLLVAAGCLDGTVRIWDVDTGGLVERFKGHPDSIYSVVFTLGGQGVISGSLDKTIKCWDLGKLHQGGVELLDGQVITRGDGVNAPTCIADFIGHQDYVFSIATSRDGSWIVSGSKDRGVGLWDTRNPQAPHLMLNGHMDSVISVDLSSTFALETGGLLATGSRDLSAKIWRYSPM